VASGQGRVASDWLFAVLLVAVVAAGASAALLMRRRGSGKGSGVRV
jgi:hypothetical protein